VVRVLSLGVEGTPWRLSLQGHLPGGILLRPKFRVQGLGFRV
jgi:hypothetical protein